MRIFETPSFDFIGKRKLAYAFSITLFVLSLAIILVKGLQYGIDFKGGKEFVIKFEQPIAPGEARQLLTTPLGTSPELKKFGSDVELLIRTENEQSMDEVQRIIVNTFMQAYPDNALSVEKRDVVSARFSDDLKKGAINAVGFAMLVIFVYIFIRFKTWSFSAGAVVALIHDIVITVGVFTLLSDWVPFSLLIDQNIIAAFLTIVGYSLNDTVVVFDRIRENKTTLKKMPFNDMINRSLNDTLSRTVITSLTTLFVVLVLFIFGGEVLKGLSFALLIGIVLGTYSSLFVASAIVLELDPNKKKA
jgi:preprotein translocase SecF subunit